MAEVPLATSPARPRPRRRGVLAVAGTAALLGGAGAAWWARDGEPGAAADPRIEALFALRCERPEGGAMSLADFRDRPVLINFWATWCPPCVEEMPLLDRFFRAQVANGWQVVGLALDKAAAVRTFLGRTPVGFPIGLLGLEGMQMVRDLGNPGGGLPFTVVVDKGAHIHASRMGQVSHADLTQWAQAL